MNAYKFDTQELGNSYQVKMSKKEGTCDFYLSITENPEHILPTGNFPKVTTTLLSDCIQALISNSEVPDQSLTTIGNYEWRRMVLECAKLSLVRKSEAPTRDSKWAWVIHELESIALNKSYSESALQAALDLPWVSDEDKNTILRYLSGTQGSTDHITLQDIANQTMRHLEEASNDSDY